MPISWQAVGDGGKTHNQQFGPAMDLPQDVPAIWDPKALASLGATVLTLWLTVAWLVKQWHFCPYHSMAVGTVWDNSCEKYFGNSKWNIYTLYV